MFRKSNLIYELSVEHDRVNNTAQYDEQITNQSQKNNGLNQESFQDHSKIQRPHDLKQQNQIRQNVKTIANKVQRITTSTEIYHVNKICNRITDQE